MDAAVIVTVYNKEKFLRDTLESILSQKTSRPFCIILSDDGSTDSSRQICSDYAARYPSSIFDITDGEHRGVSGNFLHCLKYAISLNVKYISQIDSDDILADPAFLEHQISFLESHPDAQAAASGFFLISESDDLSTARRLFEEHTKGKTDSASYKPILENCQDKSYGTIPRGTQYLISENNPLVAGGVTYRTNHLSSYLEEFAFAEDSTQDLPLWLYLSLFGRFFSCDVQSLAYRNLSESVSRSQDLDSQLKFQASTLATRLRFINRLRTVDHLKQEYIKCLDKLDDNAKLLYEKKMLRHYAKLQPKEYPAQLKKSLKKRPSLLFSKDLWRSLGVYLKNR